MELDTSITDINGIGPKFLVKLKKLGIKTIKDLLWHFPYRYEDWKDIVDIKDLNIGDTKTIQGIIVKISTRQSWKRRMVITVAEIEDETGSIKAIWFNQPYISKILREGSKANLAGKVSENKDGLYLSNPTHEVIGKSETKHTARLVPIYPETKGLTSKGIRFIIKNVLDSNDLEIEESLPDKILEENNLLEINAALKSIHFPEDLAETTTAKKRFAFEEIFLLQLRNLRQKIARQKDIAEALKFELDDLAKIIESIPFELTKSQKTSLSEILKDLSKSQPMNRLLQGDVGSGKTIIAGIAAILGGSQTKTQFQVAFMAPTEILANQHYKTLTKIFPKFDGGIALYLAKECKVSYGDGLESKISKEALKKEIEKGNIKIITGTHSLIQKGVEFKNLGLVIVDEQHRFGVEQRDILLKGRKVIPHFLSMSATPIPRTLMITIFGDLDLSIISELPKGRREIITKVVLPENRMKAYAFIRGQVRKGDQVFIICPRIEAAKEITSENGEKTIYKNTFEENIALDAKNVKEEFEKLSKKIFPDLRVSMLHGKMKSADKEKVMKEFSEKKYDILVATSVIEVGVDVPNATIIVIEGADRFGLAQLYQFKGRVGRGTKQSFCFLFSESLARQANGDKSKDRLEALLTAKNGFELAEYDLKIRGPGEFLGDSQTGLPDIAMYSLQNPELIKNTRKSAEDILKEDPELKEYPKLLEKLKEFQQTVHLE